MIARAGSYRWLAAALLVMAALFALDVASESFIARSVYVVPVLATAVRAPVRQIAIAGAIAVALALLAPLWNEVSGEEYVLPILIIASGTAIAVWAARERAAAEEERRQMGMLAEVARITDTAPDVETALQQLVDLLVPQLADAAWVDLADADGAVRRVAVRLSGPRAEEFEEWVRGREPRGERPSQPPTIRALEGHGSQLVEVDARLKDALAVDAEDRRRFDEFGARWAIAVPLKARDFVIGALGLSVGSSGRRYDRGDLAFAEVLAGRAALVLRNAQLLTDLTATQRRLDGILGALAEAVTVHDRSGRVVYANQAAAALFGVGSVQDVLQSPPGHMAAQLDMRTEDGEPVALEDFPGRRLLRGEDATPLLARATRRSDGRTFWLVIKATLLREAEGEPLAVNVIEDVTEERGAAMRQRFLAEAGTALASSLDYEQTLQRVARLAVPDLADWCAVEMAGPDGIGEQVAIAHVDPAKVQMARDFRDRYPPDPDAPTGVPAVLRSGAPQLYEHIPEEMLVAAAQDEEHLRLIRELGIRSGMVVPMIAGGRVLGAITFVAAESGRSYGAQDLAFAEDLAARAATAVENARLYTELRTVAETLQASLLPDTLPSLPGWEAAAAYQPGQREAEVGGDFYDVFALQDRRHMFILGDVTGKGIGAAALTSLVRHTAKTAALFDPRPGAVLSLVNRVLRQQDTLAPVTMLCGVLGDGDVTLAVAGHPLPLLKRVGGRPERVGVPGLLLGAVDEYPRADEQSVRLRRGETLICFTDGVTDTPGDDSRFGDHRLEDIVGSAPADAGTLLETVSSALDHFQRGAVADDRAMLAVRWLGLAAATPAAA